MAQKIGQIAYTLARQILVKDKGGIASLPQNKEILTKVNEMFNMLKAGGYTPISAEKAIKSTDDLKRVLTDVEMKLIIDKDLRRGQSEGIEEVMKKMDKGIPLNPSDQAKMEGVEKVADDKVLDAFQGFKPKVIQGGKSQGIEKLFKDGDITIGTAPKTIKKKPAVDPELQAMDNQNQMFQDFSTRNMTGIEAMKEASALIGRRGRYKNISEGDAKTKLDELEEIIKGDMGPMQSSDDPDLFAQGGIARIGMFAGGTPLRRLLQYLAGTSGKKGSQNLKDFKISDQMKFFADKQGVSADQNRIDYLEQVLESLYADQKLIKNLEPSSIKLPVENQAAQKFRKDYIDETQGGRYEGLTSEMIDKSILETETMIKNLKTKDRKPNAIGGRIEMNKGGGIMKFFKTLLSKKKKSPSEEFAEYLKKQREESARLKKEFMDGLKPGGTLEQNIEKSTGYQFPEVGKDFRKKLKEKIGNRKDNILKDFDVKGRKPNATGGIIGLKEGGPPNPGRRNFLKLMGGLASIPVFGKLFKFAKPAAKIAQLKNTTTTMPTWFPSFVDKVVSKGVAKKIDADMMRYEVKELPGIKVTKHDDGRVFVEGKNDYSKSYEIEYEPPGYVVVDESKGKAVKTKGDFRAQEEVPVNVDPDGNADFDGEILESVDNILSSDARAMEEFATGKKIKKMKRGEFEVGRAEAAVDAARKGEDFAKGGIAYMLGE